MHAKGCHKKENNILHTKARGNKVLLFFTCVKTKPGFLLIKHVKKNTCLRHAFVRKSLFSFSWCILIHASIKLKLE